jgi:putative transposase
LYLKGVSTGDFTDALTAILGSEGRGLSATNVVRLKAGWEEEYQVWRRRDLSAKRYVYWWADGVYFNVRLDDDRTCVLVLIGATEDGTKELLAVVDGFRESKDSWGDLLRELNAHGLIHPPKLATGDGSLGFRDRLAARVWHRRRAAAMFSSTRPPTCSTNCPKACKAGRKNCCMTCPWPRRGKRR